MDDKGRFAVPARYRAWLREHCNGQLVVTLHYRDPCLLIYPQPRWLEFEQQLLQRGGLNPEIRRLQRHFVGSARDLELDRQGRVLLPAQLKALVGLDGRSALVGMGHSFELWDEEEWNAQYSRNREFLGSLGDVSGLPGGLEDLPL